MVEMTVRALSNVLCEATHGPSGTVITTDAPADLGGAASAFSPTDLVGVALLSCIMTTIGLSANKMGLDLTGMHGSVSKEMTNEKPRRIGKLTVVLHVPLPAEHEAVDKLTHIAETCPVHHTIHPETVMDIRLVWQ